MHPEPSRLLRSALARASLLGVLLPTFACAQPQLPCGGAQPTPEYAAAGKPPAVALWKEEAADWQPPACLPWPRMRYGAIVALAGGFRHEGDGASLLQRFGEISALRGLRYWSVTDQAWRVLVEEASALARSDPRALRSDFLLDELKGGADLYFAQKDNRASEPVVYRLHVLEASADRLVIETENVTPLRAFLVTVFPPGGLRGAYFFERKTPNEPWNLYALSAIGEGAGPLAAVSDASYVNRAAAFYRHFTGTVPDSEPPLAP